MKQAVLQAIFNRTTGHCHFCGDAISFERRGWAADLSGYWALDHVIQRHKGGRRGADNCLPACTRCNRLRWHRTGPALRELLELGHPRCGTDPMEVAYRETPTRASHEAAGNEPPTAPSGKTGRVRSPAFATPSRRLRLHSCRRAAWRKPLELCLLKMLR